MPNNDEKDDHRRLSSKSEAAEEDEQVEDDKIDSDGSSTVSSDEDELLLAGEQVRDPNVSSSSSEEESNDDENDKRDDLNSLADSGAEKNSKFLPASKQKKNHSASAPAKKDGPKQSSSSRPRKRKKKNDGDRENVDFIFCDMEEVKFWDGCKALLTNSSALYQRHASIWTDWLMEQVIGTVVTTEQDYLYSSSSENTEGPSCAVFGFASILDVAAMSSSSSSSQTPPDKKPQNEPQTESSRNEALTYFEQYVTKDCPTEYQSPMKALFQRNREQQQPASLFLFLHGRMINLPLEIVLALHQQLWLDWEWDQDEEPDNKLKSHPVASLEKKRKKKKRTAQAMPRQESILPASGSKEPRIVRLAPCTKSNDSLLLYRYYDDELLSDRAVASYTVKAPPSYSQEEAMFLQVMVLTPRGYQQAIQDLDQLVGSAS